MKKMMAISNRLQSYITRKGLRQFCSLASMIALGATGLFVPEVLAQSENWAAPATEFLETGTSELKAIGRWIAVIAVIMFGVVCLVTQRINWMWAAGIGIGALLLSSGPQIIESMLG